MYRLSLSLLLLATALAALGADQPAKVSDAPAATEKWEPKLLITFASYRDRPKYPTIYFYEHDGVARGKIAGQITSENMRSDSEGSLSTDGRYCVFAAEVENQVSKILLWDREAKKLLDMPAINDSPNGQLRPTLSGDGQLLAFAAWRRPEAPGQWDVLLYDRPAAKVTPLPGLNSANFHERTPAFSRDGKLIAFTSNATGGAGSVDIYLYDVKTGAVRSPPGLNSAQRDVDPSLSADGRYIAFSSDRPGGGGGHDIFLYDAQTQQLLPLPGLNSVAQEQRPSISADGRYIAFVSERIEGEGERDIFLYDRQAGKLLPTPGLNARQEDIDPCVLELPARR